MEYKGRVTLESRKEPWPSWDLGPHCLCELPNVHEMWPALLSKMFLAKVTENYGDLLILTKDFFLFNFNSFKES